MHTLFPDLKVGYSNGGVILKARNSLITFIECARSFFLSCLPKVNFISGNIFISSRVLLNNIKNNKERIDL